MATRKMKIIKTVKEDAPRQSDIVPGRISQRHQEETISDSDSDSNSESRSSETSTEPTSNNTIDDNSPLGGVLMNVRPAVVHNHISISGTACKGYGTLHPRRQDCEPSTSGVLRDMVPSFVGRRTKQYACKTSGTLHFRRPHFEPSRSGVVRNVLPSANGRRTKQYACKAYEALHSRSQIGDPDPSDVLRNVRPLSAEGEGTGVLTTARKGFATLHMPRPRLQTGEPSNSDVLRTVRPLSDGPLTRQSACKSFTSLHVPVRKRKR